MKKQLTKEKYTCSHCHKIRQLIIRRRRAYLCRECDDKMLSERRAKRQALKELNAIAQESLRM